MPSRATTVAFVVACETLALIAPRSADACGGFFRRGTDPLPSLAVEQVLLVWDARSKTEQLVREVTFTKATGTFGFVVPTPSRPEVDKVDDAPFARLDGSYPFREAPRLPRGASGGGGPPPGGAGGVKVLEAKRVGSFAAFVLQATDAGAMKGWLERNKLETTRESRAWLDRYVALGFFFVALRFEPTLAKEGAKAKKGDVLAETIRLTFETPLPFYPYLEPDREADPDRPDRMLALWFVSQQEHLPVARVDGTGGARWKRPWQEGSSRSAAESGTLAAALGKKLFEKLPTGLRVEGATHVVQTFEDQKTSRKGWGDVVLVPKNGRAEGDATSAERLFAAKLLDPSMVSP